MINLADNRKGVICIKDTTLITMPSHRFTKLYIPKRRTLIQVLVLNMFLLIAISSSQAKCIYA